jgi:hypothetical protein
MLIRIVRPRPQPVVGVEACVVRRFGDAEVLDVRVGAAAAGFS